MTQSFFRNATRIATARALLLLSVLPFGAAIALDVVVASPAAKATPAPVVAVAPVVCAAPTQVFSAAMLTDTANLLAGFAQPSSSTLSAIAALPASAAHRAAFTASWAKLDARQLDKVKAFAVADVAEKAGTGPLYYPFSGPDFLYASALFPNASSYFLTGLEPVGAVPNLSAMKADELNASLADLRKSLYAVLNFSFFKTNDMRVDFRRSRFQGVVPVLLTFAAKSGYEVRSVEFFTVAADGKRCLTDAAALVKVAPSTITGVQFGLANAQRTTKLIYVSADIGDNGMVRSPQYANAVRALKPTASFLKSASFLLHKGYFSKVRSLLMEVSPTILQDDSGIPYRSYASANWRSTFFGNYVRPIPLFANFMQADLSSAYQAQTNKQLEFGIGYRYGKNDSSLLLMQKPLQ